MLQDVLARLDKTYQACFRRVQQGEQAGFPRYKGRERFHSFTYNEVGNGARLDKGFLVVSKIGRLAVRWSRPLEGTPTTVTLCRAADGWYAAISCVEVPVKPLTLTRVDTGIDLGLERFATLADGSQLANPRLLQLANPRLLQLAERHLRRAQRRVCPRVQGSHRRRKAVHLLARAHQRVRRARTDFHHKSARSLVRHYDTLAHEDLQTANMLKNQHLAKSIADAGWSACLTIRSCKAAAAGRTVVAVPPAFTSQACSGGSVLVHTGLCVWWYACPDGGTSLHRDHTAARTILAWGNEHSRAGQARQARTWAGGPSVA